MTTWYLAGCAISKSTNMYNGTSNTSTTQNSASTSVPSFAAREYPTPYPYTFTSHWRQDSGLVLDWGIFGENYGATGRLANMG